jgi:CBS domain-containing protein
MPWVPGLTVRILTHERARAGRRSVIDALVDLVRRRKLAGITVVRALEGYTHHGGVRSSGVVELGDDLPLVVEIADRVERIEAALPEIAALVTAGVLTVTDARVYFPATSVLVRDVMDAPRVVAHPDTPLATVLSSLVEGGIRMVPVVSRSNTLEGILTLGHLLHAVDPSLATHLMEQRSPAQLRQDLDQLVEERTAGERMLAHPFTIQADLPLEAAARALLAHDVTRAPVVDAAGHLQGILGESEVVAALVAPLSGAVGGDTHGELRAALRGSVSPGAGELATAGALAERDVPEVGETAATDEVLSALREAPSGVVFVVGPGRELRGVVDEHAALQVLVPGAGAGIGAALRHLSPFALRRSGAPSNSVPGRPRTAANLMRPARVTVPETMPAAEALAEMMKVQQSEAAVVLAADGRPMGILTRQAALRALIGG